MNEIAPAYFSESEYISMYSDIASAIQEGTWRRGLDHYLRFGRAEGRLAYHLDEDWYVRSYPLVALEMEQGRAHTLREHYERLGCNRGYLPHATATRPDNPAAAPSRFGGLWVDQPNAADLIAGRLEIGLITRQQAEQLQFFVDHGYVILEGAAPEEEVSRALDALERAYEGKTENLMFECPSVVRQNSPWQEEFLTAPSKALDIHWLSDPIRDLIFADKIGRFLELLFDSKPFASQSLGFYRGSAQEAHQDSAFVPYTLQRGFAASWIALEDVQIGAGQLFYYDGSHRLGDFLYDDEFKSVSEAVRCGVPQEAANAMVGKHVNSLPERSNEMRLEQRDFAAKRGDALIWHADLVHGGKPISVSRSRRSVVTHYCGKYTSPLFSERMATPLREHHGRGYYTTSHYPGLPPA